MSVLRDIMSHPANATTPLRTVARWTIHNVRRRIEPRRIITTRVGTRLLTGPVDHPGINFAVYVPTGGHDVDAFWALEQLLDAGDTFIDVGANIGLYAIQVDPLLGPTGTIFAIEPSTDQLTFLHGNLGRLESTTVVAEEAVADTQRRLTMTDPGPTTGFLTAGGTDEELMTTKTLDELVQELMPDSEAGRCVIKLDIEGWEPAAVAGSRSLLERGVRAILLEANGHQHRSPVSWLDAVGLLHRLGYRFVWPDVRGGRLQDFPEPPPRSPSGDYLAVSPAGYERLDYAMRSDTRSS